MRILRNIILPALLLPFLSACSQEAGIGAIFQKPGYQFPYDLTRPERSWNLPPALFEISGLSYIDDQRVACIQDEKGSIYIYNLKDGKVDREIAFGSPGDYEDLVIIGKDAWVLKSNGTLHEAKDYLTVPGPAAIKFKTGLSEKNDTEGLAYDPENKSLLIACKEQPYTEKYEGEGVRAVYRFDLSTKTTGLVPFLLVEPDSIRYYRNKMTRPEAGLRAFPDPPIGGGAFKPSGIAIHPLTGDIYLLSSAGKLLLVLDLNGEIRAMAGLNPDIFAQPEGICFSPDGIMYISNEGAGREGTVMEFRPEDR